MRALKLNAAGTVAAEPTDTHQQISHVLAVPLERLVNPRRRTIIMEGDQPALIVQEQRPANLFAGRLCSGRVPGVTASCTPPLHSPEDENLRADSIGPMLLGHPLA